MKINLVNIENGLQAVGFRKFSALVKQVNPDTNVYFVPVVNQFSLSNRILLRSNFELNSDQIELISESVSKADIIGFSFMSECRDIAQQIILRVKMNNPKAIIISGGTHARIYADDALSFSDIVCTGEGEQAFQEFYDNLIKGRQYFHVSGMNFKTKNGSIKNPPRAPLTNNELGVLPYIDYDRNNLFFNPKTRRFEPIDSGIYRHWLGLNLNIIWSRGCPNNCSYCYNSSFISYHKDYARIRYPSAEYIIKEIKHVIKIYPMISWVSFIDDGLLALKYEELEKFSDIYPREVGLPFLTYGTHPNYITEEKIKLLVKAGNIFFRLGVQNLSEDILGIYNRNTSLSKIKESTDIIAKYRKYLTPPGYDIILDNSFSDLEQRRGHLRRLYDLSRPYVLNLHSLRIFPGSALEKNIKESGRHSIPEIKDKHQLKFRMTIFNISHYFLSIFKPLRWVINIIVGYGCCDIKEYRPLGVFFRLLFLIRRGFGNIKKMDFSFITGSLSFVPYLLWKSGILRLYNRYDLGRRKKI